MSDNLAPATFQGVDGHQKSDGLDSQIRDARQTHEKALEHNAGAVGETNADGTLNADGSDVTNSVRDEIIKSQKKDSIEAGRSDQSNNQSMKIGGEAGAAAAEKYRQEHAKDE